MRFLAAFILLSLITFNTASANKTLSVSDRFIHSEVVPQLMKACHLTLRAWSLKNKQINPSQKKVITIGFVQRAIAPTFRCGVDARRKNKKSLDLISKDKIAQCIKSATGSIIKDSVEKLAKIASTEDSTQLDQTIKVWNEEGRKELFQMREELSL